MRLRHPLTGAIYSLREDGLVEVEHGGRCGRFHADGRHHSGELREADPHLVGWVGGPRLGGRASASRAAASAPPPAGPVRAAPVRRLSYQELLDADSRPVPEVLRWQSAAGLPPVRVPIERYVSQRWHDLEVERLWSRTWQMACREEDVPEVGDRHVYEIAGRSYLVVRSAPDEIRAFPNACLHRGRALVDHDGRAPTIRCPFHGWTWRLDGRLDSIPCHWDFPHVERERYVLPSVRVGRWGGFVFVNPDPDAAPLEDHLGELPRHFERWPLEGRYKEAHVEKRLPCNWKVAQEAFMEAYHVVATHPQLLPGIGDASSQLDAWDRFSRAITANMTPSPHLPADPGEQAQLDAMLGTSLGEEPLLRVAPGATARRTLAEATRAQLRAVVPDADALCDAELVDSFYYTLFPNLHPWGAYNRLVYRFRPDGNDPHHCWMDVLQLAPFRGERPPPAPVHRLGDDESWTRAPELGFLARVFDQDTANLARVQAGLRAAAHSHVTFANYQETKIRHFHALLERALGAA